MEKPSKVLPIPNPDTEPFWRGCARGELLLQRCSQCRAWRHPPSPRCQVCLSPEFEWLQAAGKGTIYSFVIARQALSRAWEADIPYVVAIVELEEGLHLLSNIVGMPVDDVRIGMAVEVCFEAVSEEVALPKFRPL